MIEVTPEAWDAQYRDGSWERLKGYTAHYAVIGALVRKLGAQSVLDVGCGEGLLENFLYDYSWYVGIDISREAIVSAKPVSTKSQFIVCPADDFTFRWPPMDCVVFCESLYYMNNPLDLLAHYLMFAKFAVVSIMISAKTDELVDALRNRFKLGDEVEIRQGAGGWRVMVLERDLDAR